MATKRKAGGDSQSVHPLDEILNLAAILRVSYPADAERYQRDCEVLNGLRSDLGGNILDRRRNKLFANQQHACQEQRKLCEEWQERLGKLSELVLQHLSTGAVRRELVKNSISNEERKLALAKLNRVLQVTPRHWHDLPAGEWGELIEVLLAVEEAVRSPASGTPAAESDEAAWRPASEIANGYLLGDASRLTKLLDDHPEIGSRRPLTKSGEPNKQRREVHIVSWLTFWNKHQETNARKQEAEADGLILAHESRRAAIPKNPNRKRRPAKF